MVGAIRIVNLFVFTALLLKSVTSYTRPNPFQAVTFRGLSTDVAKHSSPSLLREAEIDSKTQDFLSWATTEGITAPKCEIYVSPGGLRGLRAISDIDDGEVFLQIPLRLCFISQSAESVNQIGTRAIVMTEDDGSGNVPILAGNSGEFEWPVQLAIKLITEKRSENSMWKPYVTTLPQPSYLVSNFGSSSNSEKNLPENVLQKEDDCLSYSLPVNWNDNILSLLERINPDISDEAKKSRLWRDYMFDEIDEVQNRLLERIKNSGSNDKSENNNKSRKISKFELEWALDIVQTRNCRIPLYSYVEVEVEEEVKEVVEEEKEVVTSCLRVLAPFFDLMNHDNTVNTVFELKNENEKNEFEMGSVYKEPVLTVRYEGHGIKKNEAVTLNYRCAVENEFESALSGVDYLLYSYGFVSVSDEEKYDFFLPKKTVSQFLLTDFENKNSVFSIMKIAAKLDLRMGGVFTLYPDGLAGNTVLALRLIAASEDQRFLDLGAKTESESVEVAANLIKKTKKYDEKAISILKMIINEEIKKLVEVEIEIKEELKIIKDKNAEILVPLNSLLSLIFEKKELLSSSSLWCESYLLTLPK